MKLHDLTIKNGAIMLDGKVIQGVKSYCIKEGEESAPELAITLHVNFLCLETKAGSDNARSDLRDNV